MKPIVVFINEKDGKVTMEKEDLESLINQAYEQGKRDGGTTTITTPWTPTTWTPTTPTPLWTEVTC